MESRGDDGKQAMMKIITGNNSMMPNLFLVLVIFMLVLICLRCKNNSMSCILTHFQLINDPISATVAGNDRSWLVFQNVKKRNKRSILTSCVPGYPERDLNPHRHYCPLDFKSSVSTIPPSGRSDV